ISPDLTYADPSTLGPTGGPITMDMNGPEIYATVFALTPSRYDVNTLWAGSDDGKLSLTRDGGKTWRDITPPDLRKFTRISIIEESPHHPGTAYVAANRYQVDDRAPYVWKTTDYGETWTKIVDGIAPGDFARAIREDPERPGLLFLGTEHGPYVSFNGGAHWQPLQLNLPDTPIRDLVVKGNDVVLGTHGRGVWILDDIQPLREMTAGMAAQPLHLFRPSDGVRGARETVIQYWLGQPAEKVKVEILDAKGAVVRTYASEAKKDSAKAGEDEEEGGWRRGPEPPTNDSGLNRFRWDGRYPGATTFDGMIIWSARPERGPKAPPGEYQVRVTAGGHAETRSFQLRMDPRLEGITPADLQAQFALASEIRDHESAANEAVIEIRQLREKLDARHEATSNRARLQAVDSVRARLTELENELYQTKNRSGQDPLNFPIKLNNRIAALRRSVETGDARPTDAAYEVHEELSARLKEILGRLERVKAEAAPLLR
ncbi:MAG TPA: hypothetical protein VFI96_07450, partial [Longimicrobiaceae bacterium]|nr:hypothetical protein [Longimicrobiaceae bacterium]